MYDAAVGRFFAQDRFAEKYLDFSPYQYTLNNPIKYIDINGDSTYTYDVSTGTLTMISDVGGNEQQIVNFVDADGKAIMIGDKTATSIIDGESVYVTGTREGYLVSAYDPLEGLSADYNSQSGYEYSATDLVVRHYLKGTNLGGVIAGMEATGNAQPLAKDTHYENYVERWGTDKAFYYGLEEGYFTNVFPAGAGDALADGQKALSNASKNSKAFSPNFSQVQSPIKSQWNRFVHANKGSGKSMTQLSKEYNKLMKGK